MTDLILRARDLRVVYPTATTPRTALTEFDLDIHAGEIVGLLGESGSGKSSAALAMLGLTRHPGRVEGSVEFLGQDLLRADENALRRIRGKDIALITQKPRQSLDPLITVGGQIVRAYRSHVPASKADARVHAQQLLENVGINDAARRLNAYPHELSGGMAQRALISVAMSAHPRLLVADEPTSGLDVTIQAQFLDRMWESARTDGTAVLLVTQDLGIVANYCDRVVVVDQGRLLEDRPTADFFADPRDAYSRRVLTLTALAREHAPTATIDEAPTPDAARTSGTGPSSREQAPTALLEVRGLDKAFVLEDRGRLQAVSDVDLTLRRGRSLGLVGESGSGKTTVGRLVLRLLEADRGSITFDGQDIGSMPARRFRPFRSRMQVVFQDPFDALNPRWSVGRAIQEPLELHTDLDSAGRRRRVAELLALVGLGDELIDHRAKGLSAGQQQRVCVARALATGPDFLVLDEPTSALPLTARAELVTLLQDLQRQLGLSFIFISHDLSTVRQLCQDVAVMYLSQIVEQGSVDEVFRNPQHPYTRALLSAVLYPDLDNRRVVRLDDARAREMRGEIPSPVNLPSGCYLASRCPLAEDRCRAEPQRLHPVAGGRLVRCWKAGQEPDLSLAAEEATR